jgi:hypothetical protein
MLPSRPLPERLQGGGGATAGLVFAPRRLAAGAIGRPGSLEHRPFKPERNELIVRCAAGGPRADELQRKLPGGHRRLLALPAHWIDL